MRMDATCTTTRLAAKSGGKVGDYAAKLSGVSITAVTASQNIGQLRVMQAQGLEGAAVHQYECYTEPHSHTDSSVTVNQLPDIKEDDKLTSDGITYTVKEAAIYPATVSFPKTLMLLLSLDK